MEKNIIFRKGKRIYLRPFVKSDSLTLQRWMNDYEITQYLTTVFPVSEKQEDEWIESQSKDLKNLVAGIVDSQTDTLVGVIGLHKIDLIHRTAVTGTAIGEKEFWGKGYGTEAKMLLLDVAFNMLDLHSVLSEVYEFNRRSISYSRKCGYEEVGRIPSWKYRNGERHDLVLLIVTQERWRPLWKDHTDKPHED